MHHSEEYGLISLYPPFLPKADYGIILPSSTLSLHQPCLVAWIESDGGGNLLGDLGPKYGFKQVCHSNTLTTTSHFPHMAPLAL